MAASLYNIKTVVLTIVEQNGRFYSAEYLDHRGELIEKVKYEQQYKDDMQLLKQQGIEVVTDEYPMDVS